MIKITSTCPECGDYKQRIAKLEAALKVAKDALQGVIPTLPVVGSTGYYYEHRYNCESALAAIRELEQKQ